MNMNRHRTPLSMNRPLTPALSRSDGERVSEAGVKGTPARGGSSRFWSGALMAALLFALVVLAGCESPEGGRDSLSGSVYYGAGFNDSWYYGGYDDDLDIIVAPPPGEPPPGSSPPVPTHPIANPPSAPGPTPMPSIPSRPMPRER